MNTRENIITALNGGIPEITPLTFYSWMLTIDKQENEHLLFDDQWKRLYDMGLGICHHVHVTREVQHGVKDSIETKKIGSDVLEVHTKDTPVGSIQQTFKNGWHHEYWIKTPADYKVMTWIMDNTELVPCYDEFGRGEELVGDNGISIILASRTPAMNINVDWAGTEQFCLDLALEVGELMELYEARKKLFIQETELIAKGPGKFIKWLENLTISVMGPQKYGQLLVPIYEQCVPVYEAAGKRVMVHYDGQLSAIKDQIAKAPFHMVESLTEAPEGDMTYAECREIWPDKVLWGNINVALYYEPVEVLRQAVIDKRKRAGKKGFLFSISEDMPTNHNDSVPVVLETLSKIG
ncbi:MAG: hypothetical protein ISS77_04405 [Phycisphaerae bacterium]|nr:hypothetical protein [Planctomycetota bacterium]MBL7106832.1 hypothetical protein [Phycisphaerae bacterium]